MRVGVAADAWQAALRPHDFVVSLWQHASYISHALEGLQRSGGKARRVACASRQLTPVAYLRGNLQAAAIGEACAGHAAAAGAEDRTHVRSACGDNQGE